MPQSLTDLEQLVLLAVLQADDEAYGSALQDLIAERTGRSVTLGSLYNALVRLEERGLASSEMGEPSPVRGGKAKRLFRVTPEGFKALAEARRALERMWAGVLPPGEVR